MTSMLYVTNLLYYDPFIRKSMKVHLSKLNVEWALYWNQNSNQCPTFNSAYTLNTKFNQFSGFSYIIFQQMDRPFLPYFR